jgi:DNA modification methylase
MATPMLMKRIEHLSDRHTATDANLIARIDALLSQDLDFRNQSSGYASHNFHSFPAKFPPQLAQKFIHSLTIPGDIVLDPMTGSGTTVLEAYLSGRTGIGIDIDPLALMLSKAKVTRIDPGVVVRTVKSILERAYLKVRDHYTDCLSALQHRWDQKTRDFVQYWFAPETQVALHALSSEIDRVEDASLKAFLKLAFSAIIITKTGGVSLAFDLAHTRPHRAKLVIGEAGHIVFNHGGSSVPADRSRFLTKELKNPFKEFEKRIEQNLKGLRESNREGVQLHFGDSPDAEISRLEPLLVQGNAQWLPLQQKSIDLIVTSPPYVSNAIDYMRAHKFSLVWMNHSIDQLGQKRKEYIGGEAVTDFVFEKLPDETQKIVTKISTQDRKKALALQRYFSEMTKALQEMFRVLKPGKAAIVVVGNSLVRGMSTETHHCLAEIGKKIGFNVPRIGIRCIDRNRRMMPVGSTIDLDSMIQRRMHKEYVIGFYKPQIESKAM